MVITGIGYDISRSTARMISCMKISRNKNITLQMYVYELATSYNRRPLSRTSTVMIPVEVLV